MLRCLTRSVIMIHCSNNGAIVDIEQAAHLCRNGFFNGRGFLEKVR